MFYGKGVSFMKKINVFLADNDIALSGNLCGYMTSQEDLHVVGTVNDGKSCLDSEALSSADVLILTDILPGIDGLSLLKKLKIESRFPPVVILLTSFPTPYVKDQAMEYGANLILDRDTEPMDIIQQLRALTLAKKNQTDYEWKRKICQHLEAYGIPTHLGGFQYLCEVLEMLSANENLLHNLHADVFHTISRKYNTSPISIERRIHYAIQVAWYQKSMLNQMRSAFGNEIPSVKTFIGFLNSNIQNSSI
jgi:two-component system, response regulator, stage 0 sporulation protein A